MCIMKWMLRETNPHKRPKNSRWGRLKDWRDFWSARMVLETDFSETDAQDSGYRWRLSNSGLQGVDPRHTEAMRPRIWKISEREKSMQLGTNVFKYVLAWANLEKMFIVDQVRKIELLFPRALLLTRFQTFVFRGVNRVRDGPYTAKVLILDRIYVP